MAMAESEAGGCGPEEDGGGNAHGRIGGGRYGLDEDGVGTKPAILQGLFTSLELCRL